LWIFLGAPYIEALRQNRVLAASLTAITASVVGVVLNLALWFSLHVVFREVQPLEILGLRPEVPVLSSADWRAAVLAAGAMSAMLRYKVGMLPTLGVCAVAGVLVALLPA
jgi:chromate transporter